MSDLLGMPNLGKVLVEKLYQAGIFSLEELKEKGSRQAFLWLRKKDPETCLSTLYALEGALHNIRWHHLPEREKEALKDFYHTITLKIRSLSIILLES